jgi:hypothetical protein
MMPRTAAGHPHGASSIVPPPDRLCAHAAASPRTAPPPRGAATCSTHPAGLAGRHQAPLLPVGTLSSGSQRWPAAGPLARTTRPCHTRSPCLITDYNVQRHGLDAARGYFFMPTPSSAGVLPSAPALRDTVTVVLQRSQEMLEKEHQQQAR